MFFFFLIHVRTSVFIDNIYIFGRFSKNSPKSVTSSQCDRIFAYGMILCNFICFSSIFDARVLSPSFQSFWICFCLWQTKYHLMLKTDVKDREHDGLLAKASDLLSGGGWFESCLGHYVVSLDKMLYLNCLSSPRSWNGYL